MSRSRKKKRPNSKRNRQLVHPQPVVLHNPLTEAEARAQIREEGEAFAQLYADAFPRLLAWIIDSDPLVTLSTFAFHGLVETTREVRELVEEDPTLPHHVELLQAMMLQHGLDKFNTRVLGPRDLKELKDLVHTTAKAFLRKRVADVDPEMPGEAVNRLLLIESIRASTTQIRNWGHATQMLRLVDELFAPLDESIEEQAGVRVHHMLKLYQVIARVAEARMRNHFSQLSSFVRASNAREMLHAHNRHFPGIEGEIAVYSSMVEEGEIDIESLRIVLAHRADSWLPTVYTFPLDELVAAYPVPIDRTVLRGILDRLSLAFGDLQDEDPEHFFMGNPVWNHPLIRLPEDRYFVPVLGLLLSFCVEQMEELIRPYPQIYERYQHRRGEFLEEQTERIFRSAFPSAQVFRGVYWIEPETGNRIENDVVVLLDNYLIIAEEKGGRVTPPARRGAERRIQTTVNELVVAPSEQAQRFANYLRTRAQKHEFEDRNGERIELDTRGVHDVMVLCVTLDSIAVSASGNDFRSAGFVSNEVDLAPSISLAHLEVVMDLLDGPIERLHYLVRRSELERTHSFLADEMDLLAFYMLSGFCLRGAAAKRAHLQLWGHSHELGPYFQQLWAGKAPEKPRRRLTRWWTALIRRLEERRMPGWTRMGLVLLNATYDEQAAMESALRRRLRQARSRMKREQIGRSLLPFGPTGSDNAVLGLFYFPRQMKDLNGMVIVSLSEAVEKLDTPDIVALGFDISTRDYPCSLIAWSQGFKV